MDQVIEVTTNGTAITQEVEASPSSAPAHMARVTQDWLQANCPGLIEKNYWPQNSPDLNPLDYHVWGAMLEKYHTINSISQDMN